MKVRVLSNFAIGQTHLGKAVFAARPFKKGDVLTQFTGPRIHKKKVPKRYTGEADRYLQYDKEYYLGPSGGVDDLINHSCDPNAGLKFKGGDVLLVALRDIEVGEEVMWDYSTTMFENGWQMRCECKTKKCRKIIGDFLLLDPRLQARYRRLNIIPQYLKDYMDTDEYRIYTAGIKSLGEHGRKK
jgi:hypothetical protein